MSEKKKSGLGTRVMTGAVLIAVLVAALYFGGLVFALTAALCLTLAVYEELHALDRKGLKPLWWTAFCAVGLDLAIVLTTLYGVNKVNPLVLVLVGYTMLFFVLLFLIMRRRAPELTDIFASVLPILHIGLPGFCVLALLVYNPQSLSNMLLTLIFVIAVGGDTFAYFAGSAIGGPKLCPAISPKKTWAGALGGLAGSVGLAVLVGWLFSLARPATPFPPLWADALCGLVGGVAGQMGDLLASMVKRHCGIKDFSDIFPGHGGMLDRLDSILLTAVIVYSFGVIVL